MSEKKSQKNRGMEIEAAHLRKENALLRFLLDCVQEAICVTDMEHRFLEYNSAMGKIEGFDRSNLLGFSEAEVFGKASDITFYKDLLIPVINTGDPSFDNYHEWTTVSGQKVSSFYDIYPFWYEGEMVGVCGIGHDIDKMKNYVIQSLEKQRKLRRDENHRYTSNNANSLFSDIIYKSTIMENLVKQAKKVARRDHSVLIYGETGTGKELLAEGIHNASFFSEGPFVSVNCAAIPDTLLESILFGTKKGSFTGAVEQAGLFELAQNGTLFLDEINSMPLNLQTKLLRVLQERVVRRIGCKEEKSIHCRIISATNMNPWEAVQKGVIREDIFYRLGTNEIDIPPLRERIEDIEPLINHFIHNNNSEYGSFVEDVSPELLKTVQKYTWPGNVRELQNFVNSSMSLMDFEEKIIQPRHLSVYFIARFSAESPTYNHHNRHEKVIKAPVEETLLNSEELQAALDRNKGNMAATAREFGISRQNFYYYVKKYSLIIRRYENNDITN